MLAPPRRAVLGAWAPGRYWAFVYEGGDKVAEVAYEVVGAE